MQPSVRFSMSHTLMIWAALSGQPLTLGPEVMEGLQSPCEVGLDLHGLLGSGDHQEWHVVRAAGPHVRRQIIAPAEVS